jgi:hypothetical protein
MTANVMTVNSDNIILKAIFLALRCLAIDKNLIPEYFMPLVGSSND